jgi:hypothetical protein
MKTRKLTRDQRLSVGQRYRERLRNEGNDKQVKQERLQSLLSLVPPFLSYHLRSRTILPLVPPFLPYHPFLPYCTPIRYTAIRYTPLEQKPIR